MCEIYTSKTNISAQTAHELHMHSIIEGFESHHIVFQKCGYTFCCVIWWGFSSDIGRLLKWSLESIRSSMWNIL